MNNFAEFHRFMVEYVDFFDDMLEVEKQKLEAMISYDLKEIEHSIATQQATAKKLEQMEKRREEAQRQAGFANKTFKEIIAMVAEEQGSILTQLFDQMEASVKMIRYYNDKSLDVVKLNLQAINGVAPKDSKNEARGYTASKDTRGIFSGSSVFETKI